MNPSLSLIFAICNPLININPKHIANTTKFVLCYFNKLENSISDLSSSLFTSLFTQIYINLINPFPNVIIFYYRDHVDTNSTILSLWKNWMNIFPSIALFTFLQTLTKTVNENNGFNSTEMCRYTLKIQKSHVSGNHIHWQVLWWSK